ncbi:hypothetical protein NVS55_36285 [Myxococcus stipitatus]|uniref:hypothetical protein n=1 Tax=Myxococcus stipitatus TaxID=83455 RepID=UPI003144E278
MLTIRPSQLQAFEQVLRAKHIDRIQQELEVELPRHVRAMGPSGVRRLITEGLERAVRYGFTHVGTASLFVKLMFILGEGFDRDPRLPCAAILLEPGLDEQTRSQRMLEALMLDAQESSSLEEE